jgi:hypothetical protein
MHGDTLPAIRWMRLRFVRGVKINKYFHGPRRILISILSFVVVVVCSRDALSQDLRDNTFLAKASYSQGTYDVYYYFMKNGNILLFSKSQEKASRGKIYGVAYGEGHVVCSNYRSGAGWTIIGRLCGSYIREGNRFIFRSSSTSTSVSPQGQKDEPIQSEGYHELVVDGNSCSGSGNDKSPNSTAPYQLTSCTRRRGKAF